MKRCVNALKEWTGKARVTIIYDSVVDEFTDECLFQAVKGKPNVAIIATTTDGDVFGGFYSVAVMEQYEEFFYDPSIFLFSFESHGRCMTPQRFLVKEERRRGNASVEFCNDDTFGRLVIFYSGCGGISLGNEESFTWCNALSSGFVGIEDTTLTGTTGHEKFTCYRLVAIQLE